MPNPKSDPKTDPDIQHKLQTVLQQLRRQQQAAAPASPASVVSSGVVGMDRHLAAGGLCWPALHEIHGPHGDGAATGFAAALAGQARQGHARPVLWLTDAVAQRESGMLYPPALARYGLGDVVLLAADNLSDGLWAAEEALRSGVVTLMVAELQVPDLTASRRLHLACESGNSLCLVLCARQAGAPLPLSAARSRWQVQAAAQDCWQVTLCGGQGVRPAAWKVAWNEATLSLRLAAPAGGGPVVQHRRAA